MSSHEQPGAYSLAKSLRLSYDFPRIIRTNGTSCSCIRSSHLLAFGCHRGRMRYSGQIVRYLLAFILVSTIFINLAFILETTRNSRNSNDVGGGVGGGVLDHDDIGNDDDEYDDDHEGLSSRSYLKVVSSKSEVLLSVNDNVIVNDTKNRGIHVAVLHQATGAIMAHRFFDTYENHEDEALILFLNMISPGRIMVFAIKDEGSFQLKKPARDILQEQFGCKDCVNLGWRDMWALVTVKSSIYSSKSRISESISKSPSLSEWGEPVILKVALPLVNQSVAECDLWPKNEENDRRRDFCDKMEGFGSVCSCADPAPISFVPDRISDPEVARRIVGLPIAVIAGPARPHYLYRMLRSLLSAAGVQASKIVVYIDGFYDEPKRVADLFGIRAVQRSPKGEKNGRICHHYNSSLSSIFRLFPKSKYTIILEEDLDVSPDILYFFGQLLPIYESDPTVYCISAWNDHGYEHACGDPSLVQRVETMPGLGWVLKRSLYETELAPNWPASEKRWDWDMWMRQPSNRKGRECLYPDVSRTFHFGATGLNMNSYFQEMYFKKHSINTLPHIVLNDLDKLESVAYEKHIQSLLSKAVPVAPSISSSSIDPCTALNLDNWFPLHHPPPPAAPRLGSASSSPLSSLHNRRLPRVLFISMRDERDWETWNSVSKCLKIWDLDVRGVHKSSWRLFIRSAPFFVVGVPASPYAVYKPKNVAPLFIPKPTKKAD